MMTVMMTAGDTQKPYGFVCVVSESGRDCATLLLVITTSAKKVFFSSALVCLLLSRITQEITQPIFTKLCGKVGHGRNE